MKTLGFADVLIPKVLSGEKYKTWRLWDDKDLREGDEVLFVTSVERKPFVKARLKTVVEKPFKEISAEDWVGHEKYQENVYAVYAGYYKRPVDEQTLVKVITFEILETYNLSEGHSDSQQ